MRRGSEDSTTSREKREEQILKGGKDDPQKLKR